MSDQATADLLEAARQTGASVNRVAREIRDNREQGAQINEQSRHLAAQQADKVGQIIDGFAGEWIASTMDLDADARKLSMLVTDNITKARNAATDKYVDAHLHEANDELPLDTRNARAHEAIETGKAEYAAGLEQADAALAVLESHLTATAVGAESRKDAQLIRDEVRMLLDGNAAPADRMAELATDPRYRPVVAGQWGRLYLESRGVTKPDAQHAYVTTAAVHSSDSPAARALSNLPKLRKAAIAARQEGDMRLPSFYRR